MSRHYGLKSFLSTLRTMRNVCCISRRTNSRYNGTTDDSLSIYSSEQQSQIIDTLKKCVTNNVTRPYLNEKRLQNLQPLFELNPNIQSLEPLLSVSGIGPKLLHRICDSIIKPEPIQEPTQAGDVGKKDGIEKLKLPHSLIIPSDVSQSNVENVVSIHLGINAVSWTRLWTSGSSEVTVDRWDVMDLSDFVDKKYDVHSIWDLVSEFRYKIPDGDIYVMENNNWSNAANIKKPMKYHIQEAMLTSTICSIFNQTDCQGEPRKEAINRLYFLRTFTPSRLFNKIVGFERVSAQDTVLDMMQGVPDVRHRPITFSDDTTDRYLDLNGSLRDNMCRALLLAVSFVELILHRNPAALSVIGRSTLAKKKKSS